MAIKHHPDAGWLPDETLGDDTKRISIRIDDRVESDLGTLVDAGVYVSKAAVMRDGVRRTLNEPEEDTTVGANSLNVRKTLRLTPEMAAAVDDYVEDDYYPSASHLIRDGIQRVLEEYNDVLVGVDR